MEYKIALSPDLGLSSDVFARAWNEMPDASGAAQARAASATARGYDPSLVDGAMVVLGNVALGLATNALYDWIKQALARRGVRRPVEIREIEQPDGTRLLVVTTEEE